MPKVIAIDIGNTRLKLGVFEENQLVEVNRIPLDESLDFLKNYNYSEVSDIVVSSVVSKDLMDEISTSWNTPIIINSSSALPFDNKYSTPGTLGIDRICNAAFAYFNSSTSVSVVIDIGTCIKFDVLDKEEGYLGGSISPGIQLRYKSMHQFTGNLPYLEETSPLPLLGKSTIESMHSGVINGIRMEIEGFMNDYSNKFGDLTFFVTGGDQEYFDLASKNDIFADENLTLKGLYEIYRYNA